jgi:hypothetical protein
MPLRFTRRVALMRGLRLNASWGGLSLSIGRPAIRPGGPTSLISITKATRRSRSGRHRGERAMVRSRVLLCAVVAGLAVSVAGCQDTGYGGYYGAPYYGGGYYGGYGSGYGSGYGLGYGVGYGSGYGVGYGGSGYAYRTGLSGSGAYRGGVYRRAGYNRGGYAHGFNRGGYHGSGSHGGGFRRP